MVGQHHTERGWTETGMWGAAWFAVDQTTVRHMEGGGHPIFRNLETHCSASFISTSVFIAYYDILSNDVFSLVRLLRGTNLPFFLERRFQTPLSPCDFPPMSRPTLSHKGATETIFSSCLISQLMFSRDFPNWINTMHINTKLPC